MNPTARTENLIVTEAGGDTLVYDLSSHRAHSLDRAAALLWRLCDGTRDVPALTAALDRALAADGQATDGDASTREAVVHYALERLSRATLLRDVPPANERPLSRRELLRRAAATGVATLVVPTILSVVAPSTLRAQASCLPLGGDCSNPLNKACCPGLLCRPVRGGAKVCS